MIKNELFKRILTSIFILPILFLCTYYSGYYLILFLIFFFIVAFIEIIKNTKNLYFIFLSNLILFLSFMSFYYLRGDSVDSFVLLCWILSVVIFSDIGGYVFGKIFKGSKLTKISPNKTHSGSLGSLILSGLTLVLLNNVQLLFLNNVLINFYEFKYLVLALLFSIFCQGGDLLVSYFKRKLKIKNTGNILPGHGGVLDRIDGLIFVLILASIINKLGFL